MGDQVEFLIWSSENKDWRAALLPVGEGKEYILLDLFLID